MSTNHICLERARRFASELADATMSYSAIADRYGSGILSLFLYLQQCLLEEKPSWIELDGLYSDDETASFLGIIDNMPSSREWRTYIH